MKVKQITMQTLSERLDKYSIELFGKPYDQLEYDGFKNKVLERIVKELENRIQETENKSKNDSLVTLVSRVDPYLKQLFQAYCKRNGRSISKQIELMVKDALASEKMSTGRESKAKTDPKDKLFCNKRISMTAQQHYESAKYSIRTDYKSKIIYVCQNNFNKMQSFKGSGWSIQSEIV